MGEGQGARGTFELDEELMAKVASAAILEQISDEDRNGLVAKAVEHLMTPASSRLYPGLRLTPVQEAFDLGVETAARQIIYRYIQENPVVKERIIALVAQAFDKIMEPEFREAAAEKMADGLVAALSGERS